MSEKLTCRRLALTDMSEASNVFRSTFDVRLPWLAGLHTPEEDRNFWQGSLFNACEIWGAEQNHELLGVIAFRTEWIDQLYVLPECQGQVSARACWNGRNLRMAR